MAIAKILVPVVGSSRDASVLAAAIEAARPSNAHVVALFVRPDPTEALPYLSEGVSGGVVEDVVRIYKDVSDKAAANVKLAIESVCAAGSAKFTKSPERGDTVTISYRELEGTFGDRLVEEARVSDLVVFAPLAHNDRLGLTEAFEQVLLETDRPVLVTAETPPDAFAKKVLIGWDGGTAAAQAVTAVSPYLAQSTSVEILSIQRPPLKADLTEKVREYLLLHGVHSTERIVDPGNKSIGVRFLEAAAESGADLIVMGGYGHGRLRESLFGGVTRYVVSHASVPVFVIH